MSVAMIYGAAGSGKTVNACRVTGKNLLINTDYSSVVLANFPNSKPDIVECNHWLDSDSAGKKQTCFRDIFDAATASHKYDNIIVDNITDLFNLAVLEYDEQGRFKDPRKYYLLIYNDLKRFIRQANTVSSNVVLTAWETQNDISQRTEPLLQAKLRDPICGLCQVLGHVEHAKGKDGSEHWYYNTKGSETLMAKDQLFIRSIVLPEKLFTRGE